MEVLAFAVFIGLILAAQTRAEFALSFPNQTCAYCPMGIHWDYKTSLWTHDNGQVEAPFPGQSRVGHPALPPFITC